MTRYLSGLCAAGLGLCGGGWLVAAASFGGAAGGAAGRAEEVNLATGAGLMVVSLVAIACWSAAWRRRMRADGVLMDGFLFVSRREARRNRRQLRRDVRRTARMARQDTRAARERERVARRDARRQAPAAGSGENAAEVLSELRALLGPLLTAVEARPAAPGGHMVPGADGEEAW